MIDEQRWMPARRASVSRCSNSSHDSADDAPSGTPTWRSTSRRRAASAVTRSSAPEDAVRRPSPASRTSTGFPRSSRARRVLPRVPARGRPQDGTPRRASGIVRWHHPHPGHRFHHVLHPARLGLIGVRLGLWVIGEPPGAGMAPDARPAGAEDERQPVGGPAHRRRRPDRGGRRPCSTRPGDPGELVFKKRSCATRTARRKRLVDKALGAPSSTNSGPATSSLAYLRRFQIGHCSSSIARSSQLDRNVSSAAMAEVFVKLGQRPAHRDRRRRGRDDRGAQLFVTSIANRRLLFSRPVEHRDDRGLIAADAPW